MQSRSETLHVIDGFRLPVYFRNSVRAFHMLVPDEDLLIIDNASPDRALISWLTEWAATHDRATFIARDVNDLNVNGKVGSLYSAYHDATALALSEGYRYLHIMQGDTQVVWWSEAVLAQAKEIFAAHPNCANVITYAVSRDVVFGDQLRFCSHGHAVLNRYGLADTGIYDLRRWRDWDLHFGTSEQAHASLYAAQGREVVLHPWPCVAPIPWPAVVRNGVEVGAQVSGGRPLLLKPLAEDQLPSRRPAQAWLEDVAIPWGWTCLTPMWVTAIDSPDYLVSRLRSLRQAGVSAVLPRYERRGLTAEDRDPPRPAVVPALLKQAGLELARRVVSRGVPVLMYHSVAELPGDPYAVAPRRFAQQMMMLKILRRRVVQLEQLVADWQAGREPIRRAVAVTFDDGYADNASEAWPVLQRFGYPATLFIVTGCVGDHNVWDSSRGRTRKALMSWEQARFLDDHGFRVHSHTVTHADLVTKSREQSSEELRESRRQVEAAIGHSAPLFAYPWGRRNDEVIAEVRSAGYQAAFSVRPGLNRRGSPPWDRPRVEVLGSDGLGRFAAKVLLGRDPLATTAYLVHALRGAIGRSRRGATPACDPSAKQPGRAGDRGA